MDAAALGQRYVELFELSVGGVPHPHGGLLRLCWLMRPVI